MKISSVLKKNAHLRGPFRVILFVLAIGFTASFVFMGAGNWTFADPFFWMERFPYYSDYPTSIGTLFLGRLWTCLFGNKLLATRLLAWVLGLGAILLPWRLLLDARQRKERFAWLIAGLLLFGYGSFAEYSPGTTTLFFFSASAVAAVRYWRQPRCWLLVLLVCLTSISILMRFPNILTIVVAPVLVGAVRWKEGKAGRGLLEVVLTAAAILSVYYLLLSLLAHQWTTWEYVGDALRRSASADHSIHGMIDRLLQSGTKILLTALSAVGLAFLTRPTESSSSPRYVRMAMHTLLLMGFLHVLYRIFGQHPLEWYNWTLHIVQGGLVLTLLLVPMVKAWSSQRWDELVAPGILLLYCLLEPMGSDTDWLKLFPITACMLPVAAACYTEASDWTPLRTTMLVIFIGFCMRAYWLNPLDYTTMAKQTRPSSCAFTRGMLLSADRNDYLAQLETDYAVYGEKGNTIALGQKSPLFRCLVQEVYLDRLWLFRFDYNDPDSVNEYMSVIRERDSNPVVFLFEEAWYITQEEKEDNLLKQALHAQGYRLVVHHNDYDVFQKD